MLGTLPPNCTLLASGVMFTTIARTVTVRRTASSAVRQDHCRRQGNPWCVSAGGPGDATGWQLTDWVEEVILKASGVDYYNQWINHEVPFTDPGVKTVFDHYLGKIFFTDKYVYNGYQASSIPIRRRPWTRCSTPR